MPTVLVADDSTDIRALVRITLSSQGWRVIEAAAPAVAIETAVRERPDAVVLDVVFDGHVEDGFAVCRALRATAATAGIPVVMLTAQTSGVSRALADTAGATAYLAKPFGPMDLIATLRGVLNVRPATPLIGLLLIDERRITPAQLELALDEQRRLAAQHVNVLLGEVLVRHSAVSRRDLEHALERQLRSTVGTETGVRVVIADDHLAIRDGLRAVLSDDDGFAVVGVASDGDEALAMIRERRPQVAVLDQEMPKRTGLDVLAQIKAEKIPTAVVMFSFDSTLRERALRAGASAFLAKDAQPKELTSAVRRAGRADARGPAKVSMSSAITASNTAWRAVSKQRRAAAVIGIMAVAYAGTFLLIEPIFGASAAVAAIVAAALAGAVLGPEAGAIAGLAFSIETAALWALTQHERGEAVLTIGGNGIGIIVVIAIGGGFGAMRLVRGRVDKRERLVDALVESGFLFSGGRPQVLDLIAEAARQVIPAHALLLYARFGDGSFRVVAASGVPNAVVGYRELAAFGPVQRSFAEGRARTLNETEARSLLASARSGVVVPGAPSGEEAQGVMVALSEHKGTLDASDAATLARLAPSIWLALKVAEKQEWWPRPVGSSAS